MEGQEAHPSSNQLRQHSVAEASLPEAFDQHGGGEAGATGEAGASHLWLQQEHGFHAAGSTGVPLAQTETSGGCAGLPWAHGSGASWPGCQSHAMQVAQLNSFIGACLNAARLQGAGMAMGTTSSSGTTQAPATMQTCSSAPPRRSRKG